MSRVRFLLPAPLYATMGIHEEIKADEEILLNLRNKLSNVQKEVVRLEKEIARKKELTKKPNVTDHALLRFLERKLEINLDVARSGLLTDDVISAMRVGCKSIKKDGMEIKLQGSTVTTII